MIRIWLLISYLASLSNVLFKNNLNHCNFTDKVCKVKVTNFWQHYLVVLLIELASNLDVYSKVTTLNSRKRAAYRKLLKLSVQPLFNPYPTAFPYGNGMVLHFYQQQESSTTNTLYKVINKGLKAYV